MSAQTFHFSVLDTPKEVVCDSGTKFTWKENEEYATTMGIHSDYKQASLPRRPCFQQRAGLDFQRAIQMW